MSNELDNEFINGYLDGLNPTCLSPNGNRHPAYRHSFSIGRAELANKSIPYHVSMAAAQEIIEREDDHIPDATKMVPDGRCRAEFEKWYFQRRREWREAGIELSDADANSMWDGWQAAWDMRSCARNQDATSQFCGKAAALIAERARLRTALAQIADKDTYGVNGRGAFAQIANDALEGI